MTRSAMAVIAFTLFAAACGTEADVDAAAYDAERALAAVGSTSTTETGTVAGATYSANDGGYNLGVLVLDAKGRPTGEERLIFVPKEIWEAANGDKALPAQFTITYDASQTKAPGGTHVDGVASSVARA